MAKTMVRNSIIRLISLDDETMLEARHNLIKDLVIHYGEPQVFCHTSVWQIKNGDTITITIDSHDAVIEIESELTLANLIIDFKDKWIVAHIDCATTDVSDMINRICEIYKVDHIF